MPRFVLTGQRIPGRVHDAGSRFGDCTAIEDGDVRYTFAELAEAREKAARAFIATGTEPDDLAAIWAPYPGAHAAPVRRPARRNAATMRGRGDVVNIVRMHLTILRVVKLVTTSRERRLASLVDRSHIGARSDAAPGPRRIAPAHAGV